MELVYLWVEEYKNIKQQGFNLSPKFRCNYNPDTSVLTIEQNKEYIENLFGKNIQITAIVGKNGSGKSNLLEYLSYKGLGEHEGDQHIYVMRKDNEFIIDTTIKPIIKVEYKTTFGTTFKSKVENKITFISNQKESEEYLINVILKNRHQVPRNYTTRGKHNVINISDEIIYKKIVENSKYQNRLYDISSILESLTLLNFFRIENILLPSDIILPKEIVILVDQPKIIDPFFSPTNDIDNDIRKLLEKANIGKETINIFFKALSNLNKKYVPKGYKIKDLNKKDISDFVKILKTLYKKNPILTEVIWLHLDKKLSSGTLELLRTYANLFQSLSEINKSNILICLDEPDSFLHPNWQKQLFNHLINFFRLNYLDRNFHLVLTTHSPFLLSDIPKQNIIFLDTYNEDDEEVKSGKQQVGNCKVVDGLNEKEETFGANIHTLLSDGFFMEDGLMGEFAKSKINDLIDYLNDKPSEITNDDDAKKLINIIGEPIIKRQLEQHLKSKEIKELEEKNKELEDEIVRLKAELIKIRQEQ